MTPYDLIPFYCVSGFLLVVVIGMVIYIKRVGLEDETHIDKTKGR